MPSCAAINCSNQQHKGSKQSFHLFPYSRPEILKQWIVNMRRENFQPSKKSVVCSDHFTEECFDRTGQTTRLRPGSIPTIFTLPSHLIKVVKPRKPPTERLPLSSNDTSTADAAEQLLSLPSIPVPHQPVSDVDHTYITKDSPRCLKRKMDAVIQQATMVRKRLKYSNAKVRRLKRKVQSLTEIVSTLKKNDLISSGCENVLLSCFSGVSLEVMKRIMSQKSGRLSRKGFPEELKSFAMTLSFYSSKAYNYVRRTFQLALPHPCTIRQWYKGINGQPGFTKEAFAALSARVDDARLKEKEGLICSLMFDEMAIRKHVEWDGKKFVGYVDVGSGIDDDSAPVATEALVVMAVGLDSHWKIPVGYFLIDGMTGEERANIINHCLSELHAIGVSVCSVTCDGPSCNFSMMQSLGANLHPPNIQSWFPHPVDSTIHVQLILDACHMLKLMRNCLASYSILKDGTGQKINWNYVEQLHKLQEAEGLRLGNKLKTAHLMWTKQKMKVNLAAQTLSSSVADAIEFCRVQLKLNQFAGSEATVHFLRLIDHLFDILNSRNSFAKGYKAPMRPTNEKSWRPFLCKAKAYLFQITDDKGRLMTESKRKTPFVGLICTIEAVLAIYDKYVSQPSAPLKYLLTYKLSQDHLELFFGAVRSSCGCNNNPTVRQFTAAYKRLLVRHNIQGGLGNCLVQDDTKLLIVNLDSIVVDGVQHDTLDMAIARLYDLEDRPPAQSEHDYADIPNVAILSQYKQAVITNIAGYVVRMVCRKIKCIDCQSALTSENNVQDTIGGQFMLLKNRGGLKKASRSVIEICEESEKCFQRMQGAVGEKLPQTSRLVPSICSVVLKRTGMRSFPSLDNHMFATTPDNNHVFNLVKCVAHSYCVIRMHHLAKQKTVSITGTKVRKQLTKLVLFKGQ